MKDYLVDVPVRVNIWIRPECQKKQFEILKTARPSIMFLQSDGGRNSDEWEKIYLNRKLFDDNVDWNCKIIKIYEDKNNGMYSMSRKVSKVIWDNVDRCIFLEDDYLPAVSFFRFCAELLEKYKNDQRIQMITGNNIFGVYEDALPNDYFFSEFGWSIWGTATWKDRVIDNREYPLDYKDNEYIKNCLKQNLPEFWYKKMKGYCEGKFVDGHLPGSEYYFGINSALYHRLNIIPTRNMINNIGCYGEHSKVINKYNESFFNMDIFEINNNIVHPEYIIEDKKFSDMYLYRLGFKVKMLDYVVIKIKRLLKLFLTGGIIKYIIAKFNNKNELKET